MAEVAAKEVAALNEVAEVEAMPNEVEELAAAGSSAVVVREVVGADSVADSHLGSRQANSQRSNAGAETFGGGAGGFSARPGAGSGGAGRPGDRRGWRRSARCWSGRLRASTRKSSARWRRKTGCRCCCVPDRNNPQDSGAQGAAAGAAASNRRSIRSTRCAGCSRRCCGVRNRNNPQYSGAQGAGRRVLPLPTASRPGVGVGGAGEPGVWCWRHRRSSKRHRHTSWC